MLLKVSDGVGGWHIVDRVDKTHLLSTSYSVKSPSELTQVAEEGTINLVARECFQGEIVLVGVIEFERLGVTKKMFFTNVVYVCNDQGDTLDRLNVDRNGKKR